MMAAPQSAMPQVSTSSGQAEIAVHVAAQQKVQSISATPQQSAPQSSSQKKPEPSFFDKMKNSVSSGMRKVFGDDEDEKPRQVNNGVTPSSREFGGNGTLTTSPTTPPRNVPPRPSTDQPQNTRTEIALSETARHAQPHQTQTQQTQNQSQTVEARQQSHESDPVSAYARLRELRSQAVSSASSFGESPIPNGMNVTEQVARPAGRINVDAVERQTQQSYSVENSTANSDANSLFRQRGVSAFDDSPQPQISAYSTTASRANFPADSNFGNNNSVNASPQNLTSVQTLRDVRARQSDYARETPRTELSNEPRDPWGNPITAAPAINTSPIAPRETPVNTTRTPSNNSTSQQNSQNLAAQTEIQVRPSDDRSVITSSPLLDVETQGPQSIIVGQESAYRIRVYNRGGAAAEQVVFQIDLPSWVDVQPPDVSSGTTEILPNTNENNGTKVFRWKLDRIDSKVEDQLVLYLVPRERKAFSLKVHYDFKRPSAIAEIDVREPRLELSLDGPSKVLWGTEEVYRLRIRNVGNGDAESLRLTLLSSSDDSQNAEPFVLEMLKAGEEKTLEVKAWARQNDSLEINVIANGAYGLHAKTMRRVIVMRPELKIWVEAPELQFVGNNGEATIHIRNTGTAPAENLEIVASIPLGARFLACTESGAATPQNEVIWTIDSLPIGEEFIAKMTCELKRPGACRFDVTAREQTGLIAKGNSSTQVEAIADLAMKLQNPQGPIEVGADAIYTITLTNRGTCAAEGVEVVIAFVDSLEPIAAEGFGGEVVASQGMLLFDKIPHLGPGQSMTLRARARAVAAGTHKMRAEVICESTGTHIAHEESNLFYVKQRASVTAPRHHETQIAETRTAEEITPRAETAVSADMPRTRNPFDSSNNTLPPLTQLPRDNKTTLW